MKENYDIELIAQDHSLQPYSEIICKRHHNILSKWEELKDNEFNSYLYYGLHHNIQENIWIIREWAPNAKSISVFGDFNNWNKDDSYFMKSVGNGDWEIKISDKIFKENSLFRLNIHWDGGCGERLPSYSKRVVQDEQTKLFSAEVIDNSKYKWLNNRPSAVKNPLIYEAHIGMSTEKKGVSTFNEFRRIVLPRIVHLGYNTIQLMGIQEHPYYGSFGYQVSNFYAVSSRFGTPLELKQLIDEAHEYGISVILDIVHSHSVINESEGLSNFAGDPNQYFYSGQRGYHSLWGSKCFDYGKNEVLNFLLSNCKFWLEEYNFDGFRFDGVTSMIYWDHGLDKNFTQYSLYYDGNQDENAITYLALANKLIHQTYPNAITIAEDMSGMPGLAFPINGGGYGFDFKMSMGIPDYWIKLIEDKKDEEWHVGDIFYELTNKRKEEHTISYAESHDQAMVGDKTIFFRLLNEVIYTSMGVFEKNILVSRAMALHKIIRLATIATAGDGYLNFMGNEWGHPEWIDFPREGNNWSYNHARRLWSIVDDINLRFRFLNNFDKSIIFVASNENIFEYAPKPIVQDIEKQILIFTRGDLLFAINFNGENSYSDYLFEAPAGKYTEILDTDEKLYDGENRLDKTIEHFTQYKYDKNLLSLYLPSRTALIMKLNR